MIVAIVGAIGSGKSLLMTHIARQYDMAGARIYANYEINIPDCVLYDDPNIILSLNPEELNLVLGDEFYIYLDARLYSRAKNVDLTKIILQTRKKNVVLVTAQQSFGLVDKRLRLVTDYVFNLRGSMVYGDYAYLVYDAWKQNTMALTDETTFTFYGTGKIKTSAHKLYNTMAVVGSI